jgi:hypothetical protein
VQRPYHVRIGPVCMSQGYPANLLRNPDDPGDGHSRGEERQVLSRNGGNPGTCR